MTLRRRPRGPSGYLLSSKESLDRALNVSLWRRVLPADLGSSGSSEAQRLVGRSSARWMGYAPAHQELPREFLDVDLRAGRRVARACNEECDAAVPASTAFT